LISPDLPPVAIVCGGLATRLGALTAQTPKSLLLVNGTPFLVHQLRLLASREIHDVVLCVGHLGNQILAVAGDGSDFNLSIQYSEDGQTLLGTGGAVRRALPQLSEKFFVLYGDSYLPCDYRGVAGAFETSGRPALMTVYRNEGRFDTSNVEFAGNRVLRYDKTNPTPAMRYIDYGLGVFRREVFETRPERFDLASVYTDLAKREELAGHEVHERFYEIGSAAGLEATAEYLAGVVRR
jgi:NDP-sugar pyrophosphorylase family protein